MKDFNSQIQKLDRAIASPSTAKEFISGLKKRRDDLESERDSYEKEMAEKAATERKENKSQSKTRMKKLRSEIEEEQARVKAENDRIAAEEKRVADELAAKKSRIRKQIVRGKVKIVKRKVKNQVKAKGKSSIKKVRIPKAAKRGKKLAKMAKLPKYVKKFNAGRSKSDIISDSKRVSKAPGKHKQHRGHKHKFYYEKRANRTDVSTKYKLEKGGPINVKNTIPNNYKGKTPEEVWGAWSSRQRIHFLDDHDERININNKNLGNDFIEIKSINWYTHLYRELPEAIQKSLQDHLTEGQYKKGGSIYAKGKQIEVDDVVYNKRLNTIGIVRDIYPGQEYLGEVKTDSDGNVYVSDLELYDVKKPAHTRAEIAPSTKIEINDRKLKMGGPVGGPAKKKWFKDAVLDRPPYHLSGWAKELPAKKRRKAAVASRDGKLSRHNKYLSAGRALQALANVTTDPATKEAASSDAKYFFSKTHTKMENGGLVGKKVHLKNKPETVGIVGFFQDDQYYVKFPDGSDGMFSEEYLYVSE